MPVSQTMAKSAFSSAAFASRKGFSDGEPDSSSPSKSSVMVQGSEPLTAFQARQASTNSISCPLSSEEPRPVITLRPGSSSCTAGSKGSLVHSSSGSTGCTS